ncbi:MAG: hypothetical protein QOE90_3722 [Thermoplasmata archaeon]|nr:hypothetical protein [Thermoplasmata archaeon]
MRTPPLVPALALALAFAAAGGIAQAGPDLGAWTQPALVAGLAFALGLAASFALALLASRDPERGWALSRPAGLGILVVAGVAGFLAGVGPGAALASGLGAGWLAGRKGVHASDVAFLGAAGLVAAGVALQPSAWNDSTTFLAPAATVALALAAREAWDLADLRRAARERAIDAPVDDRSWGALLAALVVLAGATLAGLVLGLTRDAWQALGLSDISIRIGAATILLASVVGLARLFLPARTRARG